MAKSTNASPNVIVGGGGSTYYGSDGSGNGNSCGNYFYIGELGGGNVIGSGSECGVEVSAGAFNSSLAQTVAQNTGYTYGYWFLVGPKFYNNCNGATTTSEATTWGEQQAALAIQAWDNQPYIYKLTIFADVEQPPTYWKDVYGYYDTALNQAVLEGFLSKLSSSGFYKGVYSAPCAWETIMGSSYTLSSDVTTWSSEYSYSSIPQCPSFSAESPSSCGSSFQGAQGFGGLLPSIWQYYASNTLDLDVAGSLPS